MEKTILRCFSARKFSENAADLNRRSLEGWNLKKPGCLRYTFEQGGKPCRYVLDYCPSAWEEDEQEQRRKVFTDAGWELIGSTASCWDYYRKPLGHDVPEESFRPPLTPAPEETQLLASISLWFWLRIVVALAGIIPAIFAVVRKQSMFFVALGYLALILLLTLRIHRLQKRLKPLPRETSES